MSMMSALPPRGGESPSRRPGAGVSRLAVMQVTDCFRVLVCKTGWLRIYSCCFFTNIRFYHQSAPPKYLPSLPGIYSKVVL